MQAQEKDFKITSRHLFLDGNQQELVNKILSGCVPHENCKPEAVSQLVTELFSILPVTEVFGTNYIFFHLLEVMGNMSTVFAGGSSSTPTKDVLEASLTHSIANIIKQPQFNAQKYFAELGKEFNLQVREQLDEACDIVYSICLDMYDELMNLKIPTKEALLYLDPLKESCKGSFIERAMAIEAECLRHGVTMNGVSYNGPNGVVLLRHYHEDEFENRFSNSTISLAMEEVIFDTHLKLKRYKEENPNKIRPLAMFGYDPFDKVFELCTQDIVCLVADEGVGKTQITLDWVHTLVVSGQSVLVVTGETSSQSYIDRLVLNHLARTKEVSISEREFNNRELIPHASLDELEEINIIIEDATRDFLENPKYGKVILKQNLFYEDFHRYISENVIKNNVTVVVVDHVAIMRSNGARTSDGFLDNPKKKIDFLYAQEDVLTKEKNIAFINTVHTQSEVSDKLAAGKATGVNIGRGSRGTTMFGSIVMLLRTTDELAKQGVLILEPRKTRTFQKPPPIALFRDSRSCCHYYKPQLQHFVTGEQDNITTAKIDSLIGEVQLDNDDFDQDELGLDI